MVSWREPARASRRLAAARRWRSCDCSGATRRRTRRPSRPCSPGDRVVGYDEIARIRPRRRSARRRPAPGRRAVSVADSAGLSFGRRYVYVVTGRGCASGARARRRSGSSSPSSRPRRRPRAWPRSPGTRRSRLTWQRADARFIDGSPATGELRYVVLRAAGEGALAPSHARARSRGTSFTDTGRRERHRPTATPSRPCAWIRRARRWAPTSAAVAATPVDTTPPSAPTGLVAIPAAGSVRLAWNASPEEDVALYAVYRAEGDRRLHPDRHHCSRSPRVYHGSRRAVGRTLPLRRHRAGPRAEGQRERALQRGLRHRP